MEVYVEQPQMSHARRQMVSLSQRSKEWIDYYIALGVLGGLLFGLFRFLQEVVLPYVQQI